MPRWRPNTSAHRNDATYQYQTSLGAAPQRRNERSVLRDDWAAPIEFQIHTDTDHVIGQFDVACSDRSARVDDRRIDVLLRAKIRVQIFELECQHAPRTCPSRPFAANTSNPPCSGLGVRDRYQSCYIDAGVCPSSTAGDIEQVSIPRIADPTA